MDARKPRVVKKKDIQKKVVTEKEVVVNFQMELKDFRRRFNSVFYHIERRLTERLAEMDSAN